MSASTATQPNLDQMRVAIRQFLLMLEQETADRVFVARQLARYSPHFPQLLPLVHQLADSFTPADRQQVLDVLHNPRPAPQLYQRPQPEVRAHNLLKVDPELARLAIVLHLAAQLRIWLVAREVDRDSWSGRGWLARDELRRTLQQQGIRYSKRHIRRLLAEGEGLFFNLDGERVYLRGYRYVSEHLTEAAPPETRATNLPGARAVYVMAQGSLQAWQERLYLSWLYSRAAATIPAPTLMISREVLALLFGRSQDTLRRWEERLIRQRKLEVKENFAQSRDRRDAPAHAVEYLAETPQGDEIRWRWQLPNTYVIRGVREHAHRGQGRKVRRAVQAVNQPAQKAGRVARIYYADCKAVHKARRRHGEAKRYVWRGVHWRSKAGIWEPSDGGYHTQANERADFGRERDFFMSLA